MEKPTEIKDFAFSAQPLKDALAEYDRTAAERNRMWATVETSEDVIAAEQADKDALLKVQLAFHELTKDRNSLERCKLAGLDFMRRCAAFSDTQS